MNPDPDVLVVGAGPVGLTTALQAHAHGATVRVVERRTEVFRPSRAMIVHPRTMECLRPLGVTDELLDRGDRSPRAELHLGSRRVAAQLADVAWRDTAFPHLTMLRQMDVEEVLLAAVGKRGIEVERGVELYDVGTAGNRAVAHLRSDSGRAEVTCRFLAGCDGPASTARGAVGIGWHGGDYREAVVLADLELDGPLTSGVLHVVADRRGLVFLFALGEGATWRLLATRPVRDRHAPYGQPVDDVPPTELQSILDDAGLGVGVAEIRWSGRVRLQHRLAGAFRRGPVFLAGDAAHAHSPAAAQGMNTGIVDAVNLGWKLAFAASHDGDRAALLDSYEHERRPVARQVLALTHAVFFAEASTNPLPAFLRGTLAPLAAPVLPVLLARKELMGLLVRVLSQGWVHHRSSVLSVEELPRGSGARPGDRQPDAEVTCAGRRTHLHELTATPGVHVLLERDAVLDRARLADATGPVAGPLVHVHRIESWHGTGGRAVRPDGYVGFRTSDLDTGKLVSWLRLVGAA